MCVVIPFILNVRRVDAPAGVTQDFSSTFLLRYLPLFSSREGLSRPFPSSTVKSSFVYPRIKRSPLIGHICLYIYFYFFLRGKIPVRVTAPRFELTSQRRHILRFRGYQVNHRGDRRYHYNLFTVVLMISKTSHQSIRYTIIYYAKYTHTACLLMVLYADPAYYKKDCHAPRTRMVFNCQIKWW